MALVRDFPLFPLGLVALPSELVPLHIFEERYKTMIGRCLDEGSEFGIVWMSEDGLRPIGCACEIAEVVERLEDGRINLIARGTRAFRIEERQEELPYPAGTVEFLDDRAEDPDAEAAEAAHDAYADLVNEATDRTPDMTEIGEMSAYQMAATVEFGLDAKQGLLDLRSETARLRLVTRLFRAALKRLDFVNRAQARARSNGRVHFQALASAGADAGLVDIDLGLELAQQLGGESAIAAHLRENVALGSSTSIWASGRVGPVVRVAAGCVEPVAQAVEPRLVAVAQVVDLAAGLAVLGHLVEALERGVREPHPRLDLLAAALARSGRARARGSAGASVRPGSTSVTSTTP